MIRLIGWILGDFILKLFNGGDHLDGQEDGAIFLVTSMAKTGRLVKVAGTRNIQISQTTRNVRLSQILIVVAVG